MPSNPCVSIIIPTLAENKRSAALIRCIESIRNASKSAFQIITVVNGNRFDQTLCNWLKRQPDIRFVYQSTPSSPLAQLKGRQIVQTPFFCFIDDDDEFLPDAIDLRLAELQANPEIDFVVTNGFLSTNGRESIVYENMGNIVNDPLSAIFNYIWLHNCNNLFRTETVTERFFQDIHPYAEWTWLAFKLVMAEKRFAVLDTPTFRYYDTPDSASKSSNYLESFLGLYAKMLALAPPPNIQTLIHKRISSELHTCSVRALQSKQFRKAIDYHFHSLCEQGGFRYLSYSRHLFFGVMKHFFTGSPPHTTENK